MGKIIYLYEGLKIEEVFMCKKKERKQTEVGRQKRKRKRLEGVGQIEEFPCVWLS